METIKYQMTPAGLKARGVPYWLQIVAGGLFTGLSPMASGTVASLVACGLYFLLPFNGNWPYLLIAGVLAFAAGYPLVERVQEKLGEDPSFFTLDEFSGMWLTLASPIIPFDPIWALIAFLSFRTFDIAKTWPASWLDRRGGPLGVMGDDVVAALYATICAHAIWFGLSLIGLVSEFLAS